MSTTTTTTTTTAVSQSLVKVNNSGKIHTAFKGATFCSGTRKANKSALVTIVADASDTAEAAADAYLAGLTSRDFCPCAGKVGELVDEIRTKVGE